MAREGREAPAGALDSGAEGTLVLGYFTPGYESYKEREHKNQ